MTDEHEHFDAPLVDETMTSEIGKLALALSKAQGVISGALKDSTNPFFKSNYADLGNVIAACREPLSKNELAVIQTTEPHETDVIVITTLAHSSGQWIRGKLRMRPTKPDPQGNGSAMTYCRRYAYAAIVGVAQVDDDANHASQQAKREPKKIEPDPDAVAALTGIVSMEELEVTWKALSAAQRKSIGPAKLAELKAGLA